MTTCARCGADPIFAPGVASRLINGRLVTAYFCHDGDHETPGCFLKSMWADFPELNEVLVSRRV